MSWGWLWGSCVDDAPRPVIHPADHNDVEPSNGLNGWNLSWTDWKAGSAVQPVHAFTQ
ncbi:hypothetical protein [Streptomyces sp. NPDC005209]|uniref:hypothetical protein n=1 Tax=Streptomyces sp. NPDC005209 TaxID=3156715 RepID=UPI0033AA5864